MTVTDEYRTDDGQHVVLIADTRTWLDDPMEAKCRCGWSVTGYLADVDIEAESHIVDAGEATR